MALVRSTNSSYVVTDTVRKKDLACSESKGKLLFDCFYFLHETRNKDHKLRLRWGRQFRRCEGVTSGSRRVKQLGKYYRIARQN